MPFLASSVDLGNNLLGYTLVLGPFGWAILGCIGAVVGCGYLVVLMVLRGLMKGVQREDTAAQSLPPVSSPEDTRIQGK